MGFRKLSERNGSGTVTLNKDDLRVDGLVDHDGRVQDQEVHVQRLGQGAYLVRAVENGSIPTLEEVLASR